MEALPGVPPGGTDGNGGPQDGVAVCARGCTAPRSGDYRSMTTTPMKTWADSAPHLVAVAAGRAPADLVIRGGKVVNVHSREVLDGWQIAVAEGRIAYLGPDASHCIGDATEIIEAEGQFLSLIHI